MSSTFLIAILNDTFVYRETRWSLLKPKIRVSKLTIIIIIIPVCYSHYVLYVKIIVTYVTVMLSRILAFICNMTVTYRPVCYSQAVPYATLIRGRMLLSWCPVCYIDAALYVKDSHAVPYATLIWPCILQSWRPVCYSHAAGEEKGAGARERVQARSCGRRYQSIGQHPHHPCYWWVLANTRITPVTGEHWSTPAPPLLLVSIGQHPDHPCYWWVLANTFPASLLYVSDGGGCTTAVTCE